MAASVPSDKVKDKEYTNWLKVTLALYYMRSGLHTFIQSEVNCLHQSLVQKIYGGQTVPLPPCNICCASRVKRNKFTGVWAFQKRCRSFCDVWLYELLVLHTNPKSEKIYWDNTDIPSWPFNPWQCAKVFMPRGQLPSSTGPAECDAQALLTLLSNCKYFHQKLSPSGQSLTHNISAIRNKVMHNGEMKLSDTDRSNFIQQIIQLLEDPVSLKSTEDCKAAVGNIHKIDNDSVDVFFNVGLELTAMREAVNELRRELGNQEKGTAETIDKLDKLKEEYEQLREKVRKRFEDVEKELSLHENRMDTIERDIKSVKEKTDTVLQQQEKKFQEIHAIVTSEQKRFEDVETKMDTIVRDVQSVKEETESALQQQDKKCQEIHTTFTQLTETLHERVASQDVKMDTIVRDVQSVKEERESVLQQQEKHTQMTEILYERVASQDVRLHAVEENVSKLHSGQRTEKKKSCRKGIHKKRRQKTDGRLKNTDSAETHTNRRPETDGLKQLKCRTEDKLDTVRRLKCIPTTQAEKAKKLLEEERSVVIKGNPGEGKTTTALHLIDNEIYSDRRVVVYFPRDWETIDTDWVNIIVIEDIFGQYDLDPDRLKEWMVHLSTIQEHVDAGKLQVIITTRTDILSKAYSMLGSLKLFSSDLSLMLSSDKLETSEKISILNRELLRHKRNMEEEGKKKCIANFSGLIGFPQCCALFAGDINLFDRGPEFYKSPEKYFMVNITKLEDTRFLSLAFLFCSGKICEQELSPETMPESSKCLLIELAKCLNISEKKASITLLRDIYDVFLGLYVSRKGHSCIEFSHATVYEAVGHTLGNRCPEMIVKHGTPEYLYQRTYTAAAKDIISENVVLPASVYSLLAERMVRDVVKNKLVKSVVKHSAFKQYDFVVKFEELLKQVNETDQFLMDSFLGLFSNYNFDTLFGLSETNCTTFLQCILQVDEDAVRLVYNKFLKFLTCAHMKTTCCWKCREKQTLLELALYYHHFEIADKLISMKACYTHISLSNAARHNDLSRVQNILESLKMKKFFSTNYKEAKMALCNAYVSGNQSIIDLLLEEGIALEGKHVTYIVRHGDMNSLLDAMEHLKCHNKWIPHWEEDIYNSLCLESNILHFEIGFFPLSIALYLAYSNEKLDMADYLVKNGVKVSMYMLKNVLIYSQKTIETLIQHLKDAESWDPKCDVASKALENAYSEQKDDLCRLLIQEGVSLKMVSLPRVMLAFHKATQHLKDTGNWDPKCDDASEALEQAFCTQRYDVCESMIHDGVSLTMKNLPGVTNKGSLEIAQKAIQHLRESWKWNPMCNVASEALEKALCAETFDMCELLIQNGVSLTMKNLLNVIYKLESSETVGKAIQYLKGAGNWNPKCDAATKALEVAFWRAMDCDWKDLLIECDWIYLLIENGVSLTMDSLERYDLNVHFVERIVEHLIDTGNWNPKCDAASKALEEAFESKKYRLCDLLIYYGVSIRMNKLDCVVYDVDGYFSDSDDEEDVSETNNRIKKSIQQLKDTGNWNPKSDAASKALEQAFNWKAYDLCDLLIYNGVSIRMNKLDCVVYDDDRYFSDSGDEEGVSEITNGIRKAVQNLKDTGNWNPKSDAAYKVLQEYFWQENYDVCDLLIQEGVPIPLIYLPVISKLSSEAARKIIQHLKDTGSCYSKCYAASEALAKAYRVQNYYVCDLLTHEGVSLTMKNLPCVIHKVSLETAMKAIEHLKYAGNWDLMCDAASEALKKAFCTERLDVCELLILNGVSLTMKNLPGVIKASEVSLATIQKAIQNLQHTGNWNPKCDDASKALKNAFCNKNYDVCNLLICNSVSLTMKTLVGIMNKSMDSHMHRKAIQHLKFTGNWNPTCDNASEALKISFYKQEFDVCDILMDSGVSLTMKNLPCVIKAHNVSLATIVKAIQNLKDTGNWNPKCDIASEALVYVFCQQKCDVCKLLIQEGVVLTMKNLPGVVKKDTSQIGFYRDSDTSWTESVMTAVIHLKDTGNWNPKCDVASEVLVEAFNCKSYVLCNLLINEGVPLTMKNMPSIICQGSLTAVKAIQHIQNSGNWDPKCDYASQSLEGIFGKNDVRYLLIQYGVSLTMKNLPGVVRHTWVSETVEKAIQHLKDKGNWDPKCDYASIALEKAFSEKKVDVCELLIHDGVSLTMKNLLVIIKANNVSSEIVEKAIQHLKDTDNWDPKCDYAYEALEIALCTCELDVFELHLHPEKALSKFALCDLLMKNGVSLTMKYLPGSIKAKNVSLETVEKAIKDLEDTGNWDPKCEYASEALKNAFHNERYDVCNLLICKSISLTMKNLPDLMHCCSEIWRESHMKKKAIEHLKDTGNWDPKHDNASKALESAYLQQKSYVCDLLIMEAVSLTMKNLPPVVGKSLEVAKNVIQRLKETGMWYPTCSDASEALENAYRLSNCYVYDLLIHEGVLPTVKSLPWWSLESATKVIQFLKGTGNWDPKCDDASIALETAYHQGKYDVCDLLIQEGVSLTVKTFPWWSLESATKAIQFLNSTGSWYPKCDDASRALTNAYTGQNYDVCHLLIQEGVSLTVKSLQWWSLESVTKAVEFLKATGSWDPKCDDASRALINAYTGENYNICNLLIKEGVSLQMKTFSHFHCHKSIKSLKQLIQVLKVTNHWDPSSEDAESLLARAKLSGRKDICQVLIEEGVHEPEAKHSDP